MHLLSPPTRFLHQRQRPLLGCRISHCFAAYGCDPPQKLWMSSPLPCMGMSLLMSPVHSLLTRASNGPGGRITVKNSYIQEESWPVDLSLYNTQRGVFIWSSIQSTSHLSQYADEARLCPKGRKWGRLEEPPEKTTLQLLQSAES